MICKKCKTQINLIFKCPICKGIYDEYYSCPNCKIYCTKKIRLRRTYVYDWHSENNNNVEDCVVKAKID